MVVLAMFIVTRRILDALDLLEDFVILIRALSGGYELRSALKVKQIVCTGNRGQPMRDHDDSELVAGLRNLVDRCLNLDLALRIQSRRGLIQDQNPRSLDQGSGDGDSLLLTAGHVHDARVPDKCVQAVLLLVDKIRARPLQSVLHVLLCRIFVTEAQIVSYRTLDHDWLLAHVANLLAQVLQIDVLDVELIEQNAATIWRRIVEPFNELNNSGFTRA